ncbi:MAG: hypothetical protein M1825_004157 [Sarcosagium campestre]|nr:MAG: hypothetical protein M1825_004157 [Sarcosagium campestre]
MSDALCGPSNALQQFQKHSSLDRTLQQDRLASRHPALQNFRSSPGPNAGLLDPEFEAFQTSRAIDRQLLENQHSFFGGVAETSPYVSSSSGQVTDWAADFQRLQLSGSTPVAPQDFRSHAPLQRSSNGGWQQDFLRQTGSPGPQQSKQYRQEGHERNMGYGRMNDGIHGVLNLPQSAVTANSDLSLTSGIRQERVGETFDSDAFERAFQAASGEIQERERAITSERHSTIDTTRKATIARDIPRNLFEGLSTQHPIGADVIEPTDPNQESPQVHDELAETAGQLLDSVKDDQSQKFQESNFLALMRRLRDREVKVVGDDIVEDNPGSFMQDQNETLR